VAACRHDSEEVMPLEPPVIDGRMPQVVENEVLNSSLSYRILECPLMFTLAKYPDAAQTTWSSVRWIPVLPWRAEITSDWSFRDRPTLGPVLL
jgi:hypothetical protein